LARWYERLGPRYPLTALSLAFRLPHVVLVPGTAFLALYVPMSWAEFALLAVAAVVAQEAYGLLTLRWARPRLEPLTGWLGGRRGPMAAAGAWRAAASLPYEVLRQWWRGGYPLAAGLAWCLFAVWQLELAAWAIPVLYFVAAVLLAYGNGLEFFLLERAMQPVLDDLSAQLADDVDTEAIKLPLRRRLLTTLPALNVISAVAVAGLMEDGEPGLDALALSVLAAVTIALTLSFALSMLLAASVVAPIRRLEAATARVAAGRLDTRVPVVASDETGTLTRAFNRMVSGLQERERLRDAFGTFVDPELAERVARDGTDLRGEEVDVSIVFMDVRGFTAFSESAPAPAVVQRLNTLYEVVVPVILRHGGHANKFIGDGLLAVFGAPERHPDHADRAVAAALETAERVNERFGGDLRVGLGVNSGTVVVGTIGGGGRLDFTVIGDAVNTAARVESATRDTGDDVLVTAETRRRLTRDHARWAERPPVPLKGKTETVPLFAPAERAVVPSAGATEASTP
jgi:class 3 adenylate cyclase